MSYITPYISFCIVYLKLLVQSKKIQSALDQALDRRVVKAWIKYAMAPSLSQNESELSSQVNESMTLDDSSQDCLINQRVVERNKSKRHFKVMYEGVEFDLIKFNLTKMKEVMVKCGAAFTIERRNDFFDFMAGMTKQLNNHEYWKDKHTLGTLEDWFQLKE